MAEIKYKETTIPVEAGQTVILNTIDRKLTGDISIAFDTAGSFSYKGVTTEIEKGKTANLLCAGKKFATDVVVAVEKAMQGYTVQISLTEPYSPSYFQNCVIYDNDEDGKEIGRITSPTGSTEVVTSTGKLYIEGISSGAPDLLGGSNTTGGVEYERYFPDIPIIQFWFCVTGNGTITIKNIDWDY